MTEQVAASVICQPEAIGLAAGAAGAGQLARNGAAATLILVAAPATLAPVAAVWRMATLRPEGDSGAPRRPAADR
jgi:hypothetical protein